MPYSVTTQWILKRIPHFARQFWRLLLHVSPTENAIIAIEAINHLIWHRHYQWAQESGRQAAATKSVWILVQDSRYLPCHCKKSSCAFWGSSSATVVFLTWRLHWQLNILCVADNTKESGSKLEQLISTHLSTFMEVEIAQDGIEGSHKLGTFVRDKPRPIIVKL